MKRNGVKPVFFPRKCCISPPLNTYILVTHLNHKYFLNIGNVFDSLVCRRPSLLTLRFALPCLFRLGIVSTASESSSDREDSTHCICRSSRLVPRMAPFLRKHFCRCSIAESWCSSPHPRGRDLLSCMPSEFLPEVILYRTDVSVRRSSPA